MNNIYTYNISTEQQYVTGLNDVILTLWASITTKIISLSNCFKWHVGNQQACLVSNKTNE